MIHNKNKHKHIHTSSYCDIATAQAPANFRKQPDQNAYVKKHLKPVFTVAKKNKKDINHCFFVIVFIFF